MSNDQLKPWSRLAVAFAVLALAIVPLYVLSIGPVLAWNDDEYVSVDAVDTFYSPLYWLGERNERLGIALEQYIDRWMSPNYFSVTSDEIATPPLMAGNAQALADRRAALLEVCHDIGMLDWEKSSDGVVQIKVIRLPASMRSELTRITTLFPEAQVLVDETLSGTPMGKP